MANEITYTGHGNLFIAAALNAMLWENLVDKTDLRPLLVNLGLVNGTGSTASKTPSATFDDAMAAANTDEVTAASNTDLDVSSFTCTVARQVLARVVTSIYNLVGGPRPSIGRFAADMANAAVLRFTDMVAALFTNLSVSKGGTTDNDVDRVSDAQYALIQARAGGRYTAVLAPIALTDFLDSLRGEGGSAEFAQETATMLGMPTDNMGFGKWGSWRNMDFWSCDSCPTSGSDRHSALLAPGVFGYKDGVPEDEVAHAAPGSYLTVIPNGSPLFVEFERHAKEGYTDVVGNMYTGVVENEDARGVRIVSAST